MADHRFTLAPYAGSKSRHVCPKCQHRERTFSRYIDTSTGANLAPEVGRCNRETSCGYHYTPKQYYADHPATGAGIARPAGAASTSKAAGSHTTAAPRQAQPFSLIEVEAFKASLRHYEQNHFITYLHTVFAPETVTRLIEAYYIGTSKHWRGATVFWQVDTRGKVRTGKIMLYDPSTGRRVKKPFNHIGWVHTQLKRQDFALKQCLFGEHLLNRDALKTVAVVESEKTAVIASGFYPQYVWVAVGSLSNLSAERCSALRGRKVFLFPDLNGYEKWQAKAQELRAFAACVVVSNLLETSATPAERAQGYDLADYLIRTGIAAFTAPPQEPLPAPQPAAPVPVQAVPMPTPAPVEVQPVRPATFVRKWQNWDAEIAALERFYTASTMPAAPIPLSTGGKITDTALWLESSFATLRANNGNPTFLPYLHRLQEVQQFLISQSPNLSLSYGNSQL